MWDYHWFCSITQYSIALNKRYETNPVAMQTSTSFHTSLTQNEYLFQTSPQAIPKWLWTSDNNKPKSESN